MHGGIVLMIDHEQINNRLLTISSMILNLSMHGDA